MKKPEAPTTLKLKSKETEWRTNTGFVCGLLTPEFPNPIAPRLLRNEVTLEGFGVGNRRFKCASLIGDLVMLMA